MRKRILMCGEASYLSTGFSTYGLELLKYLHGTGKYEVAELAAFGDTNDPNDLRWMDVPWKFYPVFYNRHKPGDRDRYFATSTNKFGEWKFEETCIDFKPDIVFDIRDWWMMEFAERSPFRPYFHWAIMPTVDAEPQDEQWLATYTSANAVFTYSDWAVDLLRKQSGGLVNVLGSTPPGADLQSYMMRPDKSQYRISKGLDADALVIGTVMRNQKRKLYPDLMEAFAQFLQEAPADIAQKAYLYLHTSWPDVGWDIPRLLKEFGISNKVLFTYMCMNCGAVFPAFFQDAKAFCRHCGEPSALFPHTHLGISRHILAEVYNIFDVYVQYANSEGFGMPMVEAAACGLPVIATDYSAMSDVVRKLHGVPVAVQRYYREAETGCKRALPDNADFVRKLIELLSMPAPMRAQLGWKARRAVEQHYTWERTCKIWEQHFDSVNTEQRGDVWSLPANLHQPAPFPAATMSNEEFIRWGMVYVAGRPDMVNSYMAMRMIRDLNWEASLGNGMGGEYFNEASTLGAETKFQPFGRETAYQIMLQLCEQRNVWETIRGKAMK